MMKLFSIGVTATASALCGLLLTFNVVAAPAHSDESGAQTHRRSTSPAQPPPSATTHPGWSGSGGLGLAMVSGSAKSRATDAKVRLAYKNNPWKYRLFLDVNRARGTVQEPLVISGSFVGQTKRYETIANHFDVGGSAAYTLSPRTFVIAAARYDHDDFAANRWQEVVATGFGYIPMKNTRSELSFEVGPGYKRYQPQTFALINTNLNPPKITQVTPPLQGEVIARGRVHYRVALTHNVNLGETFLAEVGAKNKYYKNAISVAVAMTRTLSLKVAYENRYNSNIVPGTEHMENLFTLNLVYSFNQPEAGAASDCGLQLQNRPQRKPRGKRAYAGARQRSRQSACEN